MDRRQGIGRDVVGGCRFDGQFYRSFTLPQAVDDAAARAEFKDGVLQLELPKKAGGSGTPLAIA